VTAFNVLLRDVLLSLLDGLPLEQVLLDREARGRFDEVLEMIPPSPSQGRSAR
jgi:hypothetical protein